jgi:hypothetical protein
MQKQKILPKNNWFAISNGLRFKPEQVHSELIRQYKYHVIPGYNVCIDEIRIPCTHESCPFKQHNMNKPDPWAIESKSLHADNGYLLDFICPTLSNRPTPKEAFFQFADWLRTTERQHHLVADSNFLDAESLLKLWDYNLEGTISCKKNRPSYFWNDSLAKNLPPGYTRIASSKRLCLAATNNNGTAKIATTRCYAVPKNSHSNVGERRSILSEYHKYKGAADYFGHLYKTTWPQGCHENWLVTMLVGWFHFTLTNAYLLYSMRYDTLSHKAFVWEICMSYMAEV